MQVPYKPVVSVGSNFPLSHNILEENKFEQTWKLVYGYVKLKGSENKAKTSNPETYEIWTNGRKTIKNRDIPEFPIHYYGKCCKNKDTW